MDKKTVLLTGSSGFIGRHFIRDSIKYDINSVSLRNTPPESLDLTSYDAVIHLAALVHQMNGADKSEYEHVNVTQTLKLALQAKKDGVKQFIFMSTVKVYGEESNTIYTEITPCHPKDDYGMSKLHAEEKLQDLEDEHFRISIIRTPIVYGAGVKANIRNLIELVKKVPILPFGGIHNQRSMVYVGNLCHLIDTVIEKNANGIFLASDDIPLSTTKLIQKIATALGIKRHLIALPFFSYLLKRIKPSLYQRLYGNLTVDNTWTKQHLNFHNPYSTDEGIKRMIQGQK